MNRHSRAHTGEKQFKCDTCKMTFVRFAQWFSHMRTHTGKKGYKKAYKKTFKCDVCPLSFKLETSLTRHKRHKHTGENALAKTPCLRRKAIHPCNNCGKSFTLYHNLLGHKRYRCHKRHTGENPNKSGAGISVQTEDAEIDEKDDEKEETFSGSVSENDETECIDKGELEDEVFSVKEEIEDKAENEKNANCYQVEEDGDGELRKTDEKVRENCLKIF